MIGSFYLVQKRKVCLALFFASAAYYKYARKGSDLFLEILVIYYRTELKMVLNLERSGSRRAHA